MHSCSGTPDPLPADPAGDLEGVLLSCGAVGATEGTAGPAFGAGATGPLVDAGDAGALDGAGPTWGRDELGCPAGGAATYAGPVTEAVGAGPLAGAGFTSTWAGEPCLVSCGAGPLVDGEEYGTGPP